MRIIDIPEKKIDKLSIRVIQGGIVQEVEMSVDFPEFLKMSVDGYGELGKGLEKAKQGRRIIDVLDAVNGEKVIRFESGDYDVIKAAVEAFSWTSAANRELVEYREAVEKAQEVETPAKK